MKTPTLIASVIGGILLVALCIYGIVYFTGDDTVTPTNNQATSTPLGTASTTPGATPATAPTGGSSASLGETYANATYNFTISYPRDLNAESFGNFHALNQNDWRYGATQAKRGTPVISIPVIRVENQTKIPKKYPLFYGAEVRVGVSTDTANCYAKDDGYTNQTVTEVTIQGVTWKKFTFGDAAMQQYLQGASYRTIHANKCFVIEQIENGSRYKDETMTDMYSDADLKAFYAKTTAIVMSFTFKK
ncbi:MAG: hypothetical protein RIQ41_237 [Candidatus Parcubacteria bacterium]|jgi:hypothetical protein